MNKKMRITASVNKIVLTRNIWDIFSGIYLALLGFFVCWLSFLGKLENDEHNLNIILKLLDSDKFSFAFYLEFLLYFWDFFGFQCFYQVDKNAVFFLRNRTN